MKQENTVLLRTEKETRDFWFNWLKIMTKKSPCIFLLLGDVGAGKTASLRWILEALGGDLNSAFSPTFSLHHRYLLPQGSLFEFVNHFDLYRIESEEELEGTGFWDLIESSRTSLTIVEWAERVPQAYWPLGVLTYKFNFYILESGARRITWEKI